LPAFPGFSNLPNHLTGERAKCYLAANKDMSSFFLNYNGKSYNSDKLLISPNNRSFRYGDGFFETMKMINGKIILRDMHFERLFSSLEILQFDRPAAFTADILEPQIMELARKNNHKALARIRLVLFRGDGGLYDGDNKLNYVIQTWQMNEAINTLNDNGLVTDIFPDARKACDKFSPIKNNNYLPYAMAALWAKQNKLNDAFVLNAYNRIADASIANIFIIKDGVIKTPALTEGCISGVTRRYLLLCCMQEGLPVEESTITTDDVAQAAEIFLTNAAYGIRWVKSCGNNNYSLQAAAYLHKKFIEPLYR
jgi:branched-chain amino acid aminotransferase